MKPCRAKGCDKPISDKKLMCLYHWQRVPEKLQADLDTVLKKYQKLDGFDKGFREVREEYFAAARAAIQSVSEKEEECSETNTIS